MEVKKVSDTNLKTLHHHWLSDILDSEERLHNVDTLSMQLQKTARKVSVKSDLQLLRSEIMMKKGFLKQLRFEVMKLNRKISLKSDTKNITMADVTENNLLRDQIRKADQSVFMLKYQVSKLLSLAS